MAIAFNPNADINFLNDIQICFINLLNSVDFIKLSRFIAHTV